MNKLKSVVLGSLLLSVNVMAAPLKSDGPKYVINIKANGITSTVDMVPVIPGPGLGTHFTADSIRSVNNDIILTGNAQVQFKPKDQELSLTADKIVLKDVNSKNLKYTLPVSLSGNAVINVKSKGKNAIQFTSDNATLTFQPAK